ncbi:protein of unknown function [Methylocaldum szegediense]|uniref:Secreted protein n=1 Tax=Methylocaldum szegediense TaxID=73780 RepID=A0ABN8X389_9GAMM|nr:protein of unknown function [Methylocaldum szegediense]
MAKVGHHRRVVVMLRLMVLVVMGVCMPGGRGLRLGMGVMSHGGAPWDSSGRQAMDEVSRWRIPVLGYANSFSYRENSMGSAPRPAKSKAKRTFTQIACKRIA